MRQENFYIGDLSLGPITFSTEIGYGGILVINKIKPLYYGCFAFLKGDPIGENVARRAFILIFFLLFCSGISLSQSLDSNTRTKIDKTSILDSIPRIKPTKIAVLDSPTILDSLNQIKSTTRDSLEKISRKSDNIQRDLIQNIDPEIIGGEKLNISIPKVPSVEVPELKIPQLDQPKVLERPQSKLGGKTKIIEGKNGGVSKDTGKVGNHVSVIGSGLDSLNNIGNIDSTLMNLGESGASRIEQRLLDREELSGLSENPDIKSVFSGKLGEEGLGEGASDLQKLNPKQIQQDYFPDLSRIKEAQQSLDKFKAKYNKLSDSRMVDEGVKRHSLKGSTFSERSEISLLGNFSSFKPFVFQTSAGYRIDRHWTAGAGTIWTAGTKVRLPEWTGMRVFGQYWIKESVFVQAEYQNLSGSIALTEVQQKSRSAFLGGLGTEVQLYKSIRLRSALLYRVNKWDILLEGFESQWQATVGLVLMKK